MKTVLAALHFAFTFCNAAALPRFHHDPIKHSRISTHASLNTDEYKLNAEFEKRSLQVDGIKVSLSLVDSGYCGNISIGSQTASILSLFDLNGSQLSALSPTVEYCAGSDQCSSGSPEHGTYDASLSTTATNLSETFELATTSVTFTGTVYEDLVVIGGVHLSKQSFGYTHKIESSNVSTIHKMHSYGGIVGLSGCNEDSTPTNSTSSFLSTLISQGNIQYPGFSLWMNPNTAIGEIIIGAIDTSKYTGSLYLFDLVNPKVSYSVYLSQVSFGSKNTATTLSRVEMVFDTTTSGILLPEAWQAEFVRLFDAQIYENSTLLIPCTPNVSEIEFSLDSGFKISVPVSAFISSAVGPDGLCQSLFEFTQGDQYGFGTSFLQYVYLALATNSSQGAIAQADFSNSTTTEVIQMTAETPFPNAIRFVSPSDTVATDSSSNSSTMQVNNGSTTTAVLLATTGSLVTEALVTTITIGTSSEVITTVVTTNTIVSTGLSTSASTTSASSTPTSRTVDSLVVSTVASASNVSLGSSIATTSSTSRTVNGLVASAFVSNATSSTPATTSTSISDLSSSTNSISRSTIALVITSAPSVLTTTPISPTGTDPVDSTLTNAVVKQTSVSSVSTPTNTIPARTTNGLFIRLSSSVSSAGPSSPTPTLPLNINIFIQNSIIVTTTQQFVSDIVKAVTVTSTTTVTTTVPCSTDPSTAETLTAKIVQILLVPSPTPYVDPDCGCTKTDIVYVDEQSLTKTIYVQPASPLPSATQTVDPDVCDCVECFYTVRKTKTVTSTCTAMPVKTQTTNLPMFISGSASLLRFRKLAILLSSSLSVFAFLL